MQINLASIFVFIISTFLWLVAILAGAILIICVVKVFNGEFSDYLADILCRWLKHKKLKEYLRVEKYINNQNCWKNNCNCDICSAKKANDALYADIYKHRNLFYRIFYIFFIIIFVICIALVSIWICKLLRIDLVWNLNDAIEKYKLVFKK